MKLMLAALFAAASGLCLSRAPSAAVYPPLYSSSFPLSTPAAFLASTLGMRRLAAGMVWVQALQYYGERDGRSLSPEMEKNGNTDELYPELGSYWQQVIRLDPLFASAYLTGPATLGWNLNRYDEALALLDEGILAIENIYGNYESLDLIETGEAHPLMTGSGPYLEELKWKLYTLKSVLIYLHNEKFEEAIDALEELSLRKDIPDVILSVLAQIYARNGYYSRALMLWEELYRVTGDQSLKQSAERNIRELIEIIQSGGDVTPSPGSPR